MKMSLLLATALCAIATPAFAGVTVGTYTAGNCYPFTCNDSASATGIDYYQIYSSSAFGTTTSFNEITFSPDVSPGLMLAGNYSISFGTTAAGLGSDPAGMLSNVSTFFSGSLAPTQYSIFGSSYNYDPSMGNLVLHVVTSGQPAFPNGSGNGYLQADYSGSVTSRSYTLNGVTNSDSAGLVTTFDSGAVPEPATWAMMLMGFGMAGFGLRNRRKPTVSVTFA